MKTLISTTFLDSQKVLEKYFSKDFDEKDVKKYLFLESRNKDTYKPDYIFKNVIDDFIKIEDINLIFIDVLDELSNMLFFKNSKVYVKKKYFEKWQNIILSISPMFIISYLIFKQHKNYNKIDIGKLIKTIFEKTSLPSIFEPKMNALIKRGLNEMHMHLNGATEMDFVWQDAMQQSHKFYQYCQKSFNNRDVSEQYLQIGNFEQQDLYRLLKIASQIRDKLLTIIYDKNCTKEFFNKTNFDIGKVLNYISREHPICQLEKDIDLKNDMQYESLFFIKCFELLSNTNNNYVTKLFHYYILIYSYFQKLLVQQKTQIGFDQFQKITFNEIREHTEEKYNARFHQLQGMYDNSLSVLEGRFAPKDNLNKSLNLLKSITKGYTKEHQDKFELKLVPHFIKIKDSRKVENIITFRDLELRIKNKKSLNVLLESMKYFNFKDLIVGFDVAANELHASPEVFSPIFRKLLKLGYKNFTYHAGEDFVHILSGLRMMYEAIDFLDMLPGNRIGHGTAMGIEPKLWNQRLFGSKLTIKKGEWLDNLVFSYNMCIEYQLMKNKLNKLEFEIKKYFGQIYELSSKYTIKQIIQAWKSRKYDPLIVFGWREPNFFDDFEKEMLKEYNKIDEKIHHLYEIYHSKDSIEKYNQMIEIEPLEFFNCDELRILQNSMVDFCNDKNIVIETLPTSNIRISYYNQYKEHHILRWLGVNNSEDPKPKVVVGSDDTGIFMTNLRNEYLHIYQMLEEKSCPISAFSKIEHLNELSKIYTFK